MLVGNLCIIEDNGRILLKRATRGVSKGKWNFPGGKIDDGETSEQSTAREVLEETGLAIDGLDSLGRLEFYDGTEPFFFVDVYRAQGFSGTLRETEEGPLQWYDRDALPFDRMWDDDKLWVPMVLSGKRIRGEFHFNKGTDTLSTHRIEELDATG